jgi:hypothetical protein
MATEEQDRSDILKLHKDWWEANCGLDILRMRSVFPVRDACLMFNLNGHPYFGIDEKAGENGEVLKIGESEQKFPPVIPFRATEVYQRDNGAGDPRWTMWHFYCSPVPPETELHPCTGDTYAERGGLGWTPDGEPLSVVGID